jgi:hypothetical protein
LILAAAVGPDTCLRVGTIFMPRRGSRRMDDGSHGLLGIIPTCLGTVRGCTSAKSLTMAELTRSNQSLAERRSRSSNRNGPRTARRSCSCPIAAAGGTFIPSISQSEPCVRWRRWRRSLDCRNGCSACRPMLSPGRTGSSALIRKEDSAVSRCWMWRMKGSRRWLRRSRNLDRCALWAIALYFAPVRRTIPPASCRSTLGPAGTPY